MKNGKTLSELAAEIERQHLTKKDYVANLDAVTMVSDSGVPKLAVEGVGSFGVNDIAHNQIAEHAKIDRRYYDRMRREAPELLSTNVDHWFRKFPAPQMLRTLDGNVRAMLSPSYQPLDNYDFAGATLPILAKRKLQVMSCEITERLFRDVPVGYKMGDGSHQLFDTCAPAIILSNSEVGFGRLVVETGVYTRACTNMCLFSKGGMKRTHVGAKHRLTDGMDVQDLDAIMSNETKQKTMEALWMQVRDVLAAAFDEKVVADRLKAIAATAEQKITGKVEKVMEVVAKTFDFNEAERDSVFRHLIEGGSLTQYGLHAAITRSAQDAETYDRATELEYTGGKVIELPRAEWTRMAEAA
jgi:hypothetical protein